MCGETISMLKIRKEIECYDKVMELRPNYPKIWYNLGLGYKQKAKEYVHKSEDINKIKRKINEIGDIMHLYQIHYFTFKNIRPRSVIICQNIR